MSDLNPYVRPPSMSEEIWARKPSPIECSEGVTEIAKALLEAQKSFQALKKASVNPHFQSRYAGLDDVFEAVLGPLNKAGILVLQGAATEAELVSIETKLLHAASAQWIKTVLAIRPSKNDPQGVGSAITYGRRYTLQTLCGIAAEEDDDGNAASEPKRPKREYKLRDPGGAIGIGTPLDPASLPEPFEPQAETAAPPKSGEEFYTGPITEIGQNGAYTFAFVKGIRFSTKDKTKMKAIEACGVGANVTVHVNRFVNDKGFTKFALLSIKPAEEPEDAAQE